MVGFGREMLFSPQSDEIVYRRIVSDSTSFNSCIRLSMHPLVYASGTVVRRNTLVGSEYFLSV